MKNEHKWMQKETNNEYKYMNIKEKKQITTNHTIKQTQAMKTHNY